MSRIGNLFYRLFIDDKGLTQDAAKAGQKAGAAAGDAAGKQMTGGMKKAFSGGGLKQGLLQGLGLGVGLGAVGAIATATGAVTDAISGMIRAASDQRESMSLSKQVFEENADAMNAWADTADTAFGQSKREALDFASNFGNAFKNVGFSLDETADKSKEMTHLAADLGSAFNASSQEAATALRSGLLGESEPLRRFGVFLSEAAVQAKANAMGMKALNGVLSDGQKVAARYAIIMEQTADSQGMFGRDTESLADAQKMAQAQMENLAAELGNELLPVMVELTEATVALVTGFKDVATAADEALGPIGGLAGLIEVLPFLGAGAQAFRMGNEIKKAAKEAAAATGEFKGKAKDDLLVVSTSLGKVGDASGTMATEVKADVKVVETSWTEMRDTLVGLVNDLIDKAFDPIIEHDELIAINAEVAAARRILASGKASKAEKADALATLHTAQKATAEHLLTLARAGATNTAAYKTGMENLKTAIKNAKGPAKAALQEVLDKIREVEREGKVVPINIRVNRSGNIGITEPRAAGGPVMAGMPYVVGEKRRELFIPDVDGRIRSSVPSSMATSAAGMTISLTVNAGSDTSQLAARHLGQTILDVVVDGLREQTARTT